MSDDNLEIETDTSELYRMAAFVDDIHDILRRIVPGESVSLGTYRGHLISLSCHSAKGCAYEKILNQL